MAIVRGQGDAYALRRAYHEDSVHDQYRPQSAEAAAMFESAEQARVEAIGSIAMKGVAANLTANLEQRLNAAESPRRACALMRRSPMRWASSCARS